MSRRIQRVFFDHRIDLPSRTACCLPDEHPSE